MEQKPMKEQRPFHSYREDDAMRPVASHYPAYERGYQAEYGRSRAGVDGSGETRRCSVRPPDSQEDAWNQYAQRRKRRQRRQAQLAPASFMQVERASTGPLRPPRQSRPLYPGSPIPRRSGQLRKRRSFWRRLLGIVGLTLLILLGIYFVFNGAAFRIDHISIVGTHDATLVQSIQHMGIQGQNIFLLDAAALATRIGLFPLVASAQLDKQWPNQLAVTIVERTPVLLWQMQQGTYSVDSSGVVIAPASQTTGADHLMMVVDTSSPKSGGKALHPGARLPQADVNFALQVGAFVPSLTSITAFTLRYERTAPPAQTNSAESAVYVIESPDGWVAYLGGPSDPNPLENRLRELQQILVLVQQQQFQLATIDLRFGLYPVYTLKS